MGSPRDVDDHRRAIRGNGATPARLVDVIIGQCGQGFLHPDPTSYDAGVRDAAAAASRIARGQRPHEAARRTVRRHEVRAPLAVVATGIETLLVHEAELDPSMRERILRSMRRQLASLETILEHLDDVDEAAGEFVVSRGHMGLRDLVRDEVTDLVLSVPDHHVVLDVDGPHVVAFVDDHAVRRILAVLLQNAVVHTPPGTTVAVRMHVTGDCAAVTVSDDGPGVAGPRRDRVFDRGIRGRDTPGGDGLGLFLARGLAEAHGGTLELTTPDGGSGCTFRLSLPLPAAVELDEAGSDLPMRTPGG